MRVRIGLRYKTGGAWINGAFSMPSAKMQRNESGFSADNGLPPTNVPMPETADLGVACEFTIGVKH